MLEVTLNTARTLPVQLVDSSGVPVTGAAFGDVTPVAYSKNGAALGSLVITALNWTELGQGLYTIDFTASELDTEGFFTYMVQSDGGPAFLQYENTVQVVLRGQAKAVPAFNESTGDLVVRSWLEIDGQVITNPVSVSISVRDQADVEQFVFTSNAPSAATGFFTMTEASIVLLDDHNYSMVISIVYGGNTYVSGDCLLPIA
jgi:hypothetical protein